MFDQIDTGERGEMMNILDHWLIDTKLMQMTVKSNDTAKFSI